MDPNPDLEIVTIFESDDLVAFQLAKAALEEAGIEFTVSQDAPPGFGFSPMLTQMRRILIPAARTRPSICWKEKKKTAQAISPEPRTLFARDLRTPLSPLHPSPAPLLAAAGRGGA
jgi:hypothetical protein